MRAKSTDHNVNLWRSFPCVWFVRSSSVVCEQRWRKKKTKKKLPQLRLRCGSKAIIIMRPSRREKNLLRSMVKISKSRSWKCRALQVLLSFALSTSYASKPTSCHALLVRCLACDDRFSSLSSIFFRFLKPNWYLSLSLCFAFVFLCPLYRWRGLGGSILPICCAL